MINVILQEKGIKSLMEKVKINGVDRFDCKLVVVTGRFSLFNRKQLHENINIGIGCYLYILLTLNSST